MTDPATVADTATMADTATYVYAITRDVGGAAAGELTGVAGADVRALATSGLRAYVSTVPLAQFGEEPLRHHLEDLAWLEGTARAHHGVVEAAARTAPTAPVRLVTVYRGDEHVLRMLDQRADEFAAVLARISGRDEWGIKVYAMPERGLGAARDLDTANDTDTDGPDPDPERDSPGTAYLKRRRRSLRGRENVQRRALSRAEAIDTALTAIAVATRRHRPQDPQLSGRDDWMVLNGAYLVDEDRADEFAATVESLRGSDVDVQVTGPWAPYSFAILESTEPEPDVAHGS